MHDFLNENPAIPLAHHLVMASGDGVIELAKEGGCSRDDAYLNSMFAMACEQSVSQLRLHRSCSASSTSTLQSKSIVIEHCKLCKN